MDFVHPIFPAKAGTQLQPERLGMTRHLSRSKSIIFRGSIWTPAFAGESGVEKA